MISIHNNLLYDNHCYDKIPICLPAGMAAKSSIKIKVIAKTSSFRLIPNVYNNYDLSYN